MDVEIKDFGPISYLRFNLDKDLHLIYGENAIGKSYATYFIYCLLKNVTNKALGSRYIYFEEDGSKYEKYIKTKLKNLKNQSVIDCTKDYKALIEDQLKEVILKGLQNSLLNTFSSLKNLKNRYSNKNFEIVLTISESDSIVITSDDSGNIDLAYNSPLSLELVQKSTKSTKYSLYVNKRMEFGKPNENDFIRDFTRFSFSFINRLLRRLDFNIRDIYYLPASRSGLYQALNAFTPIIAELTQSRFFIQNKNIELPALSEPLSDYFIDLSTVDKKHTNKEYNEIINLLQNDILKGEVEYNDKTKRITYKPNEIDLELNLSEASSMVAEMSPLVLYFKHIINNKFSSTRGRDIFYYDPFYEMEPRRKSTKGSDVIFIEEPEAHLHPEVQIKLIEVFAKLSMLNLKIFITSHSNYMFNKLNNLIIKSEISESKIMVYHLIRGELGTIQNKEMIVTKDGINDENFQDISERLYYERLNYLENADATKDKK